jgi:hypothetical protein
MTRLLRENRAQAGVEMFAALPLVLIVMAGGWQLVVAGHTWWKVTEAARLAARARYVAEERGDAASGVRRGKAIADSMLASSPAKSRRVVKTANGGVSVSARVPLVTPFRGALGAARGPMIRSESRMSP